MNWSFFNGALGALVALAVLVVIAVVLRLLWRKLLVRGHAPGRLGRWLAENTATPVFLLILAIGAQIFFSRLADLPSMRDLAVAPYLRGAMYIFTVLAATWVGFGLVEGFSAWYMSRIAPVTESKLESELMPAFRGGLKLLIVFVSATVVLDHYGFKLTALLGAAGVASLAVALAAQDTLANVIAGFTIIADRPFRVGDRIELPNGRIGDVYEIGLRSTRMLSLDHSVYIVPNSELAKSSILNHSYPSDRTNVRLKLSVPHGNDPALIKKILVDVCSSHPSVLPDPPPQALLSEFGENSLQVSFNFWIADYRKRGQVLDEVNTMILERFAQEGIKISVQREVLLVTGKA